MQINCSIVCSTSQTLEFNRDLKVKLEIIVGSIFVFRSQSDFAIFFFGKLSLLESLKDEKVYNFQLCVSGGTFCLKNCFHMH